MGRRVVPTILIGLVLIATIAVIATSVYQAGVARGLAEGANIPQPQTGTVPPPYYWGPYGYHAPFGFGFFGFLFPLLFIFLIFALLRSAFWAGRWGGHGSWRADIPSRFEEWHRRAHESMGEPGTKA
jgi:hypothetical protein